MGEPLRSHRRNENEGTQMWGRSCMSLWVKVRCGGALLRRIEGTSALKLGQRCVALEAGDDRGRAVCSLEDI